MRRSSKHSKDNILRLNDFSGGLNLSINEEMIAQNELSQAENWEYTYPTGKLKTRAGIELFKDTGVDIDTLFYADNLDIFMFTSGTTLYKLAGGNVSNLGAVTGSNTPTFCIWDAKILIASGGALQSYDGTTLIDISGVDTNCPDADIVFTRAGRVVVARTGYDRLIYSGVGDETNWTTGTDGDMIEIDIGYKDGGDIVAVTPLSSDIVVFKSSGSIFRVVAEYPDWAVYEVTRSHTTLSRFSVVQMANSVYFMSPSGFMSLNTVQQYGNVQTSEEGYKVNSAISAIADAGARIWHVASKGQIWVRPETSEFIWVYHTINKAWTTFKMAGTVTGHASLDSGDEYISIGHKIYTVGSTQDEDVDYVCYLRGKKFIADHDFLIKRTNVGYIRHTSATGAVSFGLLSISFDIPSSGDIAYSDTDIAFSDTDELVTLNENKLTQRSSYRTDYIEPTVTIESGSITMKEIALNIVEV